MSRRIVAIVPAAGIGSRMQASKPKQYLEIQGKTLLEHSLQVLLTYPLIERVIVALAENDPYAAQLNILKQPKIQCVIGGASRADSVLNGLSAVQNSEVWVMVHDAARPCLTHEALDRLVQVQDKNGAILAIPCVDTIKRSNDNQQIRHTEDRAELWQAQTPQFFPADVLKSALERAFQQGFNVTDEASAMELMGFRPHLIEGERENIKVTHPSDLALATFYLSTRSEK